jgi:hypothetical protein
MGDDATLPSRAEIIAVLDAVLGGTMSRKEASDWAHPWITEAHGPGQVRDVAAWQALVCVGMIDLPTTDRPYLYGEIDIEAWRNDLHAAP